ncbi:MAG: ATP-binding protein [Candidatus Dormibacteraeota bacterium]|nr:ATP-binding protein [Candidatus Dormibacteraeota bacterium]
MPRLTVRERLAPEITASLFSNYRNAVDALLELIDNAVDSRLPEVGLAIDLTLRTGLIQIVTTGGEGMGPREVERNYLRWGRSGKRGRDLLGQYGQGGKAAVGYLGSRLTVEVSQPGDEISWRLEDREYRDRSRLKTYELREVTKRVDEALGYVRIRIEGVDRRVDVKRVTERVSASYRPLLEEARCVITLNGQRLLPAPLPAVERHDFRVRAGGVTLTGWVGALPERSGIEPGVRCYRLGRLVADGEWFGHPGPAQSPGLARLVGEVEIPRLPLTMNKTDFDRDDPAWAAVEDRMHRVLAPLVKRLSREEQPPPPASAVRAAEQVRRLLGQALRLLERNELFEGFELRAVAEEPSAGGPGAQPELELEPAPEPDAGVEEGKTDGTEPEPGERPEPEPWTPGGEEDQQAAPPSPPPPETGAKRRRGVGRIELRALGDPGIRSLTLEEDGTTVIVINTQHPLFNERRGDVWYQLETAAREITGQVEGISLAEYERQVNQVILLALGIRGRRRRRRTRQPTLRL